jgi:hypothetical protein
MRRKLTTHEIYINTPKGRKEFLKGKKIGFACCFCPKMIEENDKNIVFITIGATKQFYFSHFECFKKRMTKMCRKELVKK